MDIRKLQRAIVDGLEDVKGQNIQVFNTEHLSPLFERVIVASGTSNRQTRALASSVREAVKKAGLDVLRTEGEDNGEWIIVDCGAAVVHLMQPQIREYYHLEEIWGEKAVRLKAAAPRGLPKASEPADAVAAPRRKKAGTAAPSRRSGSAAEALKNQPVADRPNRATRIAVAKGEVERSAPKKQRVGSSSPARSAKAAAAAAAAPARKAAPRKAAVGAKPTAAKRAAPASAAKRAAPASAAKRAAPASAAKRAAAGFRREARGSPPRPRKRCRARQACARLPPPRPSARPPSPRRP
jgi:ribosome-associated protein